MAREQRNAQRTPTVSPARSISSLGDLVNAPLSRRKLLERAAILGVGVTGAGVLLDACGAGGGGAAAGPVSLQVVDAGGFTALAQPMINSYPAAHQGKVTTIEFLPRVQAPDLPGKLKVQQSAGRVTTSIILSGYDGVASCVEQGLVIDLTPSHASSLPNLASVLQDPVKRFNTLANGYALIFTYTPSGPLWEYDPTKVTTLPQTISDLKAWIQAHPGKFEYARPRNSGPGRTMLMGLPYLLGDSNPQDPINGWSNTWAFLKAIDPYIDYYPSGTGTTMKELGEGTRWMIASTFGWDINPRFLAQVPIGDKTFVLQNTKFVADAAFVMIPKGLDSVRQGVAIDLLNWMLQPAQQAQTYDEGYFYPGPAIQNVPVTMAPSSSQAILNQYGRPEYASIIANATINLPLSSTNLIAAFDKWDTDIGGSKLH